MSETQVFASVWDALEDSPEAAAHMRLRSDQMIAICDAIDGWHVPPTEAAARLGLVPPRLDELVHGRISRFSLDDLVGLAERAGVTMR